MINYRDQLKYFHYESDKGKRENGKLSKIRCGKEVE